MSVQRRKDSKGRVLKNGESQRKDGSFVTLIHPAIEKALMHPILTRYERRRMRYKKL